MKTRFLLGFLLTAILLAMTVSAINFTVSTPEAFIQGKDSVTFKVTNTAGSSSVTVPTTLTILGESAYEATFTVSGVSPVPVGNVETLTITPDTAIDYSKIYIGKNYSGVLSVHDLTDTRNIPVSIEKSYCNNGVQGSDLLDLEVDISNKKGYGEEDNEWYPLDEIEVEATVDNIATQDIDNIIVEWCLYNPEKGKCTDIKDEENDFNLKEDKDNKVVLSFKVNPDDLDEKVTDYIFLVKAYSDDKDFGEDKLCIESSEDITIMRDSHFVVLDDISIPESVPCDGTLELTAKVWNIGEDDESDVYAMISNKDLGINERIDIGDIDALDNQDLSFNFKVPTDADEKTYPLNIKIYDENDDIFENDNNDQADFVTSFKVAGNCTSATEEETSASVTAELASDAVAGQQLVVKATIENTGTKETTYTLSATGYSAWAQLDSIDLKTVTLKAGESKDFNIYLNVKEDATGEQLFTILADHESATTKQDVSVMLGTSTGAGITGATIAENIKSNWFIWVIVIINIILIIAIIAVARRIATSR